MTGKHYNWHKRWRLDIEARRATHECGLVVEFAPRGGGEWDGQSTPESAASAMDALLPKHGAGNAAQMLARLMREAGELWAHRPR